VLWDVDYTLIVADGVGRHLYQAAFAELYGGALPSPIGSMAGRTDSAIALEVLTAAGLPEPESQIRRFQGVLAALAPQLRSMVRERGRVLPGAAEAVAALASPVHSRQVVQSLLTGNIPALARVKLGALDLTEHLDLSVGAYGDVSRIRADLVPVARRNAAARYGADFAGQSTVLVGDTPHDIQAAAVSGARAVGVATGSFSVQQLIEAGADAVLPDLTDTRQAVDAILDGQPG
jgi:phosphoglycolate phosphatase